MSVRKQTSKLCTTLVNSTCPRFPHQALESYLQTLPSEEEHNKTQHLLRSREDENERLRLRLSGRGLEEERLKAEAKKDRERLESSQSQARDYLCDGRSGQ